MIRSVSLLLGIGTAARGVLLMRINFDRRLVKKPVALAAVLVLSVSTQGCLAAAWLATVGIDTMRTSDVEFLPFEASWVSHESPADITAGPSLSSITLFPVEGDAPLEEQLIQILQRQTALRIHPFVGSAEEPQSFPRDETDRATLAKVVARRLGVDAVLFGCVTGLPPHPSNWGWKEEESRRLFLYLIDRDGHLLWKDELPFTVITGAKPPLSSAVQASLTHHFMDHVRDLGLDTLGYLPPRTS
jgi:hypothetical protein